LSGWSESKTVIARREGVASRRANPGFSNKVKQLRKPYYWALLPDSLESIKDSLQGLSYNEELFRYLDPDSIESTLKKDVDSFETSVMVKNTLRLAALLVWVRGNESESRIVNTVDVSECL
jgi:hypothetical protein